MIFNFPLEQFEKKLIPEIFEAFFLKLPQFSQNTNNYFAQKN
jgi:hypothetical protein